MKANIKLSIYLPLIVTIITIVVTIFKLEYFDLIFIIGALYIDIYYLLSYLKREDALIITNQEITIKSAFKTKSFVLSDLSDLKYKDGDSNIRAVYYNKSITVCNNIYSKDLKEIYNFLNKEISNEAVL